MFTSRAAVVTGTLIFTIFLAGCGSGDSGPTGTSSTGTSSTDSPNSAGSAGTTDNTENAAAPTVAAQVVATFPRSPAYTQGLIFVNDTFYESIGGYGSSYIRQAGLQNGEVIQRETLPGSYYGEGLTKLGDNLYLLTLNENSGLIYNEQTLQATGTFNYEGQGWGLTTDGTSLIMSSGSNVLQYRDPSTFGIVRTVEVTDAGDPVSLLNELEWIRGEIWANVWRTDKVARINPQTGRVSGWVDVTALAPSIRWQSEDAVANGIAYDEKNDRIFVTGKLWPVLYEISVPR